MQRKFASFKHILFPDTGCDNFTAFNIIKYSKTNIPDMIRCLQHLSSIESGRSLSEVFFYYF